MAEAAEAHSIVIAGGGICGLATALALHRKGIASLVLEKSRSLRADGAGIGVHANGWRVLEQLGVAADLRDTAHLITVYHDVWKQGDKISREKVPVRTELRCLNRKDLIEALAKDIPAGTIRFGCRIAAIDADPAGGHGAVLTMCHDTGPGLLVVLGSGLSVWACVPLAMLGFAYVRNHIYSWLLWTTAVPTSSSSSSPASSTSMAWAATAAPPSTTAQTSTPTPTTTTTLGAIDECAVTLSTCCNLSTASPTYTTPTAAPTESTAARIEPTTTPISWPTPTALAAVSSPTPTPKSPGAENDPADALPTRCSTGRLCRNIKLILPTKCLKGHLYCSISMLIFGSSVNTISTVPPSSTKQVSAPAVGMFQSAHKVLKVISTSSYPFSVNCGKYYGIVLLWPPSLNHGVYSTASCVFDRGKSRMRHLTIIGTKYWLLLQASILVFQLEVHSLTLLIELKPWPNWHEHQGSLIVALVYPHSSIVMWVQFSCSVHKLLYWFLHCKSWWKCYADCFQLIARAEQVDYIKMEVMGLIQLHNAIPLREVHCLLFTCYHQLEEWKPPWLSLIYIISNRPYIACLRIRTPIVPYLFCWPVIAQSKFCDVQYKPFLGEVMGQYWYLRTLVNQLLHIVPSPRHMIFGFGLPQAIPLFLYDHSHIVLFYIERLHHDHIMLKIICQVSNMSLLRSDGAIILLIHIIEIGWFHMSGQMCYRRFWKPPWPPSICKVITWKFLARVCNLQSRRTMVAMLMGLTGIKSVLSWPTPGLDIMENHMHSFGFHTLCRPLFGEEMVVYKFCNHLSEVQTCSPNGVILQYSHTRDLLHIGTVSIRQLLNVVGHLLYSGRPVLLPFASSILLAWCDTEELGHDRIILPSSQASISVGLQLHLTFFDLTDFHGNEGNQSGFLGAWNAMHSECFASTFVLPTVSVTQAYPSPNSKTMEFMYKTLTNSSMLALQFYNLMVEDP